MNPKLLNENQNLCSGSICLFTSILQPCFSVSTNSILWRKLHHGNTEFSVKVLAKAHQVCACIYERSVCALCKKDIEPQVRIFFLYNLDVQSHEAVCGLGVGFGEELRRFWPLGGRGAGEVARCRPEGSRRQGALRARLVSGPRPEGLRRGGRPCPSLPFSSLPLLSLPFLSLPFSFFPFPSFPFPVRARGGACWGERGAPRGFPAAGAASPETGPFWGLLPETLCLSPFWGWKLIFNASAAHKSFCSTSNVVSKHRNHFAL